MRDFASGNEGVATLPPHIQRSLMTSLVMSAMGERKKEFLTEVRQWVELAVGRVSSCGRNGLLYAPSPPNSCSVWWEAACVCVCVCVLPRIEQSSCCLHLQSYLALEIISL